MYKISDLLKIMLRKDASDLFITAHAAPSIKVDGNILQVADEKLSPQQSIELCYSLMNEQQRNEFTQNKECNFAIHPKQIGRFRVNVFRQQGHVGMVVRSIKTDIPSLETLRLPKKLEKMIMRKRGLLIFVGGTGTGKSTTMASLIDYRNRVAGDHIITIEDPIEFLHSHKKSIITQREVGLDTDSFESALVNAMRQAPDVIQIGEIRTRQTMENALLFAQAGHFCIATLHTNNTYQALDRIMQFFPAEHRDQLAMDLSLNLYGLISQRLIPMKNEQGRVAALEIMLNTPIIGELIKEHKTDEIRDIIEKSTSSDMQSFDQSLFDLHEKELISYQEAMNNAESENNLRLRIKLQSKRSPSHLVTKSELEVEDDRDY